MRWWTLAGGAAVVAAAAGTTGVLVADARDEPTAPADDAATEQTLVTVEQRDLSREQELDGTTGHGDERPLVLPAQGTLTALPTVGTIIENAGIVAEVDGRPVIALFGAVPMWRDLGPSVTDGKDVLHLEFALAALGYAEAHDLTVDDDWTSATTAAVKAFQEDHGQDDDGTVQLGEIVWIDGPARVGSVGGVLGQDAGEAAIELTAAAQTVHLDVPVEDADLVPQDAAVQVELPSGERLDGTVSALGAAETAEDGSATLPVDVTVNGGSSIPDGLPVAVVITTVAAEGVLAVPVEAVLALAEGGYALEVADGSGATRLVGVELGVFADGLVQVTGDIAAGDQVVSA
jgi:hypothetical protein